MTRAANSIKPDQTHVGHELSEEAGGAGLVGLAGFGRAMIRDRLNAARARQRNPVSVGSPALQSSRYSGLRQSPAGRIKEGLGIHDAEGKRMALAGRAGMLRRAVVFLQSAVRSFPPVGPGAGVWRDARGSARRERALASGSPGGGDSRHAACRDSMAVV